MEHKPSKNVEEALKKFKVKYKLYKKNAANDNKKDVKNDSDFTIDDLMNRIDSKIQELEDKKED